MPIKFSCHKCASVLRVAEQHIGKQAKCPKSGEKCVVPAESQAAAAPTPLPAPAPPAAGPPSGFPSFGEPTAPAAAPNIAAGAGAVAGAGAAGLPAFGDPSASPYSAPMPSTNSGGGKLSNTVMHPLYQARNMMQWFGWSMFVIGIIYCITIVGALIGWLPIWMGSLVKGAAQSIKVGVERGDQNQLRLANQKLATFFRILGVLAIINVVILSIYVVIALIAIIFALIGAA